MRPVDLIRDGIIKKKPDAVTDRYRGVFHLRSATGVLYVTSNSPQFISGHLRLCGKDNGQYPFGYRNLIEELFGSCDTSDKEIEVCSGDVVAKSNLITVDVNPAKNPTYVLDGQHLPEEWNNRFGRWSCDPPYSQHAATEMYGTNMPSITQLLTEGARVTKPGGLMFYLLGAKNMQWHPKTTIRIGWLGITIVPNQEIRAIHCYLKRVVTAQETNEDTLIRTPSIQQNNNPTKVISTNLDNCLPRMSSEIQKYDYGWSRQNA